MSDESSVLHPKWRAWVVDNLVRGSTADELVAGLIDADVPAERARALVAETLIDPAVAVARTWAQRAAALEQIVQLRAEHRGAQDAGNTKVPRRSLPELEEFVARYWVPGVPAVFDDLVPRWPAWGRWSPEYLADRFGDVQVRACIGRDGIDRPDAEWQGIEREIAMRDFVALVQSSPGNDAYLIAKNGAFTHPQLRALAADLVLPAALFGPSPSPARMGFWFGSAGTHTPLHHDADNSMFCQVVGRKRFRLAPPESVALLERSRGVYCHWDPRGDDEVQAGPQALLEVVVEAGDALFIPAGWWHQVDALEISISVTVLDWALPNDFGWYRPGTRLAGRGG